MDLKKLFFEKNEGDADRAVRIILGAVFAYAFFQNMFSGLASWLVLAVGLILLVTGFMGHCSVYSLFGFSTRK